MQAGGGAEFCGAQYGIMECGNARRKASFPPRVSALDAVLSQGKASHAIKPNLFCFANVSNSYCGQKSYVKKRGVTIFRHAAAENIFYLPSLYSQLNRPIGSALPLR